MVIHCNWKIQIWKELKSHWYLDNLRGDLKRFSAMIRPLSFWLGRFILPLLIAVNVGSKFHVTHPRSFNFFAVISFWTLFWPQNSKSIKGQMRYLVYCMENAVLNLPPGEEQMVWLIDFDGFNLSHISVKVTQETAHVLQDCYPERLGLAILYNPPKFFEPFWMVMHVILLSLYPLLIFFIKPSVAWYTGSQQEQYMRSQMVYNIVICGRMVH